VGLLQTKHNNEWGKKRIGGLWGNDSLFSEFVVVFVKSPSYEMSVMPWFAQSGAVVRTK
jgi:hypothetical protein